MTLVVPPSSSDSTRGLLQRAKRNATEAWQKIARLYGPLVFEWGRRAGLQNSDAADVTQEVFLAVFQSIATFEAAESSGDAFRGWLWTITRNKIRDAHRRGELRPTAEGGPDAAARFAALPDHAPEDSDEVQRRAVYAELSQRAMSLMKSDFEEKTWQAFWKTAVESQPAAAVAVELEMTQAAVYMAKSRVLRRLRDELDGLMPM